MLQKLNLVMNNMPRSTFSLALCCVDDLPGLNLLETSFQNFTSATMAWFKLASKNRVQVGDNLIEISAWLHLTTVVRLTYSRHDHISMSVENYTKKQHCLRVLRLILGLDRQEPKIFWSSWGSSFTTNSLGSKMLSAEALMHYCMDILRGGDICLDPTWL